MDLQRRRAPCGIGAEVGDDRLQGEEPPVGPANVSLRGICHDMPVVDRVGLQRRHREARGCDVRCYESQGLSDILPEPHVVGRTQDRVPG